MAKKPKKNILSTIFTSLILIVGILLLLYPSFSNVWNEYHQSRAIAGYAHAVEDLTEMDYENYWAKAQAYNQTLVGQKTRFHMSEEEREIYHSLLNIEGNGIMAYVEIPKLSVKLPIYHGTDDSVLQVAGGHIEGSSLPVGGASTHTVLSGHRGLPSAKLFTNLNRMKPGDVFRIHVLDEVLTYEVTEVNVVLPDDVSLLEIVEGEDLCTLVTCTPYGVNSHRLLVRAHRIPTPVEEPDYGLVPVEMVKEDPLFSSVLQLVLFIALIAGAFVLVGFLSRRRRKKRSGKGEDVSQK